MMQESVSRAALTKAITSYTVREEMKMFAIKKCFEIQERVINDMILYILNFFLPCFFIQSMDE